MTKTEEELEITKFNYKCLKDEYKKLNEKYKELDGYYDELNDRYINKLNGYNATLLELADVKKDSTELVEKNRSLIVESRILAVLLIICLAFILVG